jgi:hypothetical protein
VYPVTAPGLFFYGKIQTWEWIMICEHKITAKKNGDFLLEGEGVKNVIQSGNMLAVKLGTDTVKLTLVTEEAVNPEADTDYPRERERCGGASSNDTQQLAIADWIIANDGCGGKSSGVCCDGTDGRFKGTPCPNNEDSRCQGARSGVKLSKEWIEKYHQRKADAAQKKESKKICGVCRYTQEGIVNFNQIVLCEKRGRTVPASFDGCSCFKPRTNEKSASESGAEAEGKKEMQGETGCHWLFRPSATSHPDVSVSDVCVFLAYFPPSKPSACVAAPNPDPERIAQLEKENAELQNSNSKLRKELVWQFEQMLKEVGKLQDQNTKLREKLDSVAKEKNSAHSLVEQLYRRIKDLERKASERSWPPRPIFFL